MKAIFFQGAKTGIAYHYVYCSAGDVILYLICSCVIAKGRICTSEDSSFARWQGQKDHPVTLERRWDNCLLRSEFYHCSEERICLWWIHQAEQMPSRPRAPLNPRSQLQLILARGRAASLRQNGEQPRRSDVGYVKTRQGTYLPRWWIQTTNLTKKPS